MLRKTGFMRIICVFVAAILLTGCGGGKENSPKTGSGDGSPSEQAAPKETGQAETGEISADELVAKGKAIAGMSFDYIINSSIAEENISGKIWVSGEDMRSEMESPMGEGKMINIINSKQNKMYICYPDQNMAVQMDLPQSKDVDGMDDPMEGLEPGKMKYVGKETIEGKQCAVYEVTENGKTVEKLWIWEEYGMPLRVETEDDSGKVVIEYKNVE